MSKSFAKPAESLEIEYTLPTGVSFHAVLDGGRAVYLPSNASLLVTDLHWGKAETFRQHGIPIPDQVLAADLDRLSALIDRYQPQRLLVLGDLIHGLSGLTEPLHQKILDWRSDNGLPITLIAGNHDRKIESVAELWGLMVIRETLNEPPFSFSHHPQVTDSLFTWSGHIHPAIRLTSFSDSLRLPCFHFTQTGATLPAFSEFTGGYNIQPELNDRIFALSEGLVIPIS